MLQTSYNLKYNQASNLQRHQAEDYLKTKNIQKALEEMQLQEEEVKLLHEREQKDKEVISIWIRVWLVNVLLAKGKFETGHP